MKAVISIIMLCAIVSSLPADSNEMLYDPLRIFDEELLAAQKIKLGGEISFYTGLALFLVGATTFGIGYWMMDAGNTDENLQTITWSGVGGGSFGVLLSVGGMITWLVGNSRAFRSLEGKGKYLRITSKY